MNRRWLGWIVLAVGLLIVVFNTFFIVDQRESAIVVRFGDPERVINAPGRSEAGLHMKQPFVEDVVRLDRRNLGQEVDQEEIISSDQQRLVVDAFIRYRIGDPLQFYRTLRDERTATDRIDRLLNSTLRDILGSTTQTEIISTRRAELMQASRIEMQRRAKAARFGVQVIDVRIKRADLPAQIQASVFRRMRTAREQIAAQTRAMGEQQKRQIMATADKTVTITLATATEEAETTRGQGDAQRTRIFAQAYGRDPAFAAFYRSMQAYDASLANGDTTLVIAPDSDFFKYFERGPGGAGRR
ncbi:MAG TPA: protease modulator HflC [Phenylobacterium sp.]|uniref:protease modulator HflC n=1 Tax=Phenylobacterium sp. TaxID=1871053 RepID=UPI002BC589E5|nr:protease modulator HflC [Phenylobacterium sp.]HSV03477.1 protease modulator HflC [Phenylobacterium sp.]